MHQRKYLGVGITIFIGLIVIGALVWTAQYFAWFEDDVMNGQTVQLNTTVNTAVTPSQPVQYRIETVAEGLFVPWSIVFTSEQRMLVTERSGSVRAIENGLLQSAPLYTFTEISNQSEEGLMGMALDPAYAQNKFLYVCVASPSGDGLADTVVQLRDEGDRLIVEQTIIDAIPAAQYHAGCRLAFGPDGKLYITTGDATDRQIAQDVNSLGGKILRINSDGSIPADNPFPHSPVYSYGHRNPQGLDWHPDSGALIVTEHGPSVFDGPAGGDEVNRIEAGKNYGWPIVSHDEQGDGLESPLIQFTPAVAPASALVYDGAAFPAWRGQLFFGGLGGEGVYRVEFTDVAATAVQEYEKLDIDVGRVRDVIAGPDGYIYFSTSNRDGRGEPRVGDDRIYRIVPE